MQLIIEVTDEEAAALDLVAFDKIEWITNLVKDRARTTIAEYRNSPDWTRVAVSLGDPDADDKAVLKHGVDTGLLKTAAERDAEVKLAIEAQIKELHSGEEG